MNLVDLNILLYAINPAFQYHETIKIWWEDAINGKEPVGMPWVVILGFLRIATNPRIFPQPLTAYAAIELDKRPDQRLRNSRKKVLNAIFSVIIKVTVYTAIFTAGLTV